LTQQGISRSRLEAVASFGETRPVIATRTVTEVTGFVEPGRYGFDGKYAAVVYRTHTDSAERVVFDEVSAGVAN